MSDGFVYFIQEEETGRIKIGFTEKHPEGRLKDFQTGNSNKLILLGYIEGTYQDESNLHQKFSEERGNGEWFEFSTKLKEGIKELLEEAVEGKKSGIDDLNRKHNEEKKDQPNHNIKGKEIDTSTDGGYFVGEWINGKPWQGKYFNKNGELVRLYLKGRFIKP